MKTFKIIALGFVAGLAGAFVFYQFVVLPKITASTEVNYQNTSLDNAVQFESAEQSIANTIPNETSLDFTEAAARAIPSVVYINSISQGASSSYWDLLFGGGNSQTRVSSGSGVITSSTRSGIFSMPSLCSLGRIFSRSKPSTAPVTVQKRS
jgi:S1-C subfamily serine protease